jgi:general stress protein CsbA
MMLVARGVIGGILLFLGRELNFLFAAAMAALIALRLTPLLPLQWPQWSDYVFIVVLALLAAVITIRNERVGYVLSGFLVGGSFLVEYYEPGVLTLPLLPFLVGGAIGALILGVFTEWALMIVSCLVGAYYLTNLFTLSSTAEILIGSGLFIFGALTQVILMRMQKKD